MGFAGRCAGLRQLRHLLTAIASSVGGLMQCFRVTRLFACRRIIAAIDSLTPMRSRLVPETASEGYNYAIHFPAPDGNLVDFLAPVARE